jgi:hypothetical protein
VGTATSSVFMTLASARPESLIAIFRAAAALSVASAGAAELRASDELT